MCSIVRQFTALLQWTISAERWKLHIVDTVMGNRSLRLPLHLVSAEPCPAEPEGLLSPKQQLQWRRRRRTDQQPRTGISCLTAASFPSVGKGQTASQREDFPELPYKMPSKGQTRCGVNGYKSSQMEPDHSPADQVSPCHYLMPKMHRISI